eukprot:117902-Pyramimonas_sp.AAC.1
MPRGASLLRAHAQEGYQSALLHEVLAVARRLHPVLLDEPLVVPRGPLHLELVLVRALVELLLLVGALLKHPREPVPERAAHVEHLLVQHALDRLDVASEASVGLALRLDRLEQLVGLHGALPHRSRIGVAALRRPRQDTLR